MLHAVAGLADTMMILSKYFIIASIKNTGPAVCIAGPVFFEDIFAAQTVEAFRSNQTIPTMRFS